MWSLRAQLIADLVGYKKASTTRAVDRHQLLSPDDRGLAQ
jgi:hypothetical protein